MRTHLITGGAGFIGSHLVDRLLDGGERVVVIDDLSTGSLENLAHRRDHPNLRIVVESVLKESVVNALVQQVDGVVYHLAAAVGVSLIVEKPVQVIETNILGTSAVLHCCRRHGVPFFLASTSEVYGKLKAPAFSEDADMLLGPTTRCRWSYACSKAIDEFMALAFARDYDMPVVVARFFNTTGPRQTGQYGMVVPRFVRQALAGEPITVYGSGRQTRCFAHVNDVVSAVLTLMQTPVARGQIVNLGTDESVTIEQLARRVKALTGTASPIVHIPFEEAYAEGFDAIEKRRPDLTKARRLIGYSPRCTLDDILRDVIEWERTAQATV